MRKLELIQRLESWIHGLGEQACDAGIKWGGLGSCSGAGLLARSRIAIVDANLLLEGS